MIGQTVGHYRIESNLGKGGMGVVYKAHDTHLNRPVAIKVLASEAVANPERRRRFVQEAKAASALNHPNIITIYDISTSDGVDFIAMEYVEGHTLDRLLGRKGLALSEALKYAVQIADALSRAHAVGIVHRDLKPANIMVTEHGHVKLLDFGLAKLTETDEDDPSASTRICADGEEVRTEEGTILGTVTYMSPEQAEGRKVDARSDIFSFGAVLYEIVTGQRAFRGATKLSTLSAILHSEPKPLRESAPELPEELEKIIDRCLRKDPERRIQHIGDVKLALQDLQEESDSRKVAARRGVEPLQSSRRWWIAAAAALTIAAAGAGLYYRIGAGSGESNQSWTIRPMTSLVGIEWGPTWSPDGNLLAYSHSGAGNMDIYVMPTGGGDPVRLTTNPADDLEPRWSPDGRYLAFVSDRGSGANVYLIPPLGGAERKLAETNIPAIERFGDLTRSLGANPWSPDGRELLFPRMNPGGQWALWKVEVGTGKETQVTNPPTGSDDKGGSWSPDGRWIVFDRRKGGRTALWLMPAGGGAPRVLLDDQYSNDHQPAWSSDGKRVIFASLRGGPLNIWDIDVASHHLRQLTSGPGQDQYPVVSRDGKLAYSNWNHQTDLYSVELGRSGSQQRLTSHTGDNFNPRISADGKKIVYQSNRSGNNEIWLLDLENRAERQLTSDPGDDRTPDWSPDGREIVFLSNRDGSSQVWVMNAEGANLRRISNQSIQVTSGGAASATSFSAPRWSPDGKAIGYLAASEQGLALWTVDPDGKNARPRLRGALAFDWYRDSRHVVYTRRAIDGSGAREMLLADLESRAETVIHRGPTVEITAARDGSAVAYCYAVNHVGQELYVLRLGPAGSAEGLPRPLGEPEKITHGQGNWHVHGPSWSVNAKTIVYTRDADQGDIYVIENYRSTTTPFSFGR